MSEELESLGQSLCRSIGAGRFDEAHRIADRCAALHSIETHTEILAIFERARRVALARHSFDLTRLADVHRARQYVGQDDGGMYPGVTG